MVVESALSAARDEDELLDASGPRLFDGVLDHRLVDDRQHLLGDGLGGRKGSGAEPGDREYGLSNAFRHCLLSALMVSGGQAHDEHRQPGLPAIAPAPTQDSHPGEKEVQPSRTSLASFNLAAR